MKTGAASSMLTKAIAPVRDSISWPPLRRGLPRKQQLPRIRAMWIIRGFLLIPLALACFALSPTARAVDPPPDGGYPNANTAEGEDALFSLDVTIGVDNTANGWNALSGNFYGSNNTATGSAALEYNTGSNNTATGTGALKGDGQGTQPSSDNTATGAFALQYNSTGSDNTANGFEALFNNTTGSFNAANGSVALFNNETGIWNTATGWGALNQNIDGSYNTADGLQALVSNTSGTYNTACGLNALYGNTTGSNNTGLGSGAGGALTTGSDNIDIGHGGFAGDSAKIRIGTKGTHKNTYIAGINGVTVARGVGVIIDTNGHLGTVVSSARFKDAIKSMDKASEAILALKPVTFRYKQELDPEGIPQFGLVAEQVEKVNPDLVARDEQGKAYTVRYEAVNAMLLNEFLKEHHTVQELKSTAARQEAAIVKQQKQIEALTTGLKAQASQIQKVSAQLEVTKPAPQMVFNNQ
jgi:uncharacterized coiled-coil protein SlyX